jgi:hypothetical protein
LLKRIHVNQHVIRQNRRSAELAPPLSVKTYKSNSYAFEVEVHGPCRVVYSPERPLPCGARVWIETDGDVTLHDGSGETSRL